MQCLGLIFTVVFAVGLSAPRAEAARGPVPKPIQPKPPVVEAAEIPGLPPTRTPTEPPAPTEGGDSRAPAQAPAEAPRPSAAVAPGAATVTRVVGEVGEQIITSREVQINDIVEQAAFGRLPGMTAIRVLKGSEKTFPNEVGNVLREWVVYLEARAFESGEVPKIELQQSIRAVQDGVAALAAWSRLEPSSQEVAEILERKIVAKRFLRLKSDSAQVPITDAEALAYYKKNRLKFGNLPFTSFRENIKAFLIKQQMDRRLQDWLEVLERKYKVRNFIAG